MKKVMITAAITGAGDTTEKNKKYFNIVQYHFENNKTHIFYIKADKTTIIIISLQ